ncbi:SH3 domain-containing protein [Desulfosporosinus sp. FKA]|uniref:SH3 domain-containing protein n=1 Tax=Desulfosporosinus sp. FKA TaxID=1969834 RepID=UPI000B497B0F|nr:SH3 domain-containing protein [Desulfosporosinus sp. FKA]
MIKIGIKGKVTSILICSAMLLGSTSLATANPSSSSNVDKVTVTTPGSSDTNSTDLSNNVKSNAVLSPQWMNVFTVTASSLSVRSGAGTSFSIIGTLPKGYTGSLYNATEITANGYTWVPIYNSSHTALWGWIAKQYIEIIG